MIRSIFQFPSAKDAEEPAPPAASSSARSKSATQSPAAPTEDRAASFITEAERTEPYSLRREAGGLIPASQLPSAADILADLFSEDRPAPAQAEMRSVFSPVASGYAGVEAPAMRLPEAELPPEGENLAEPTSSAPGAAPTAESLAVEPLAADSIVTGPLATEPAAAEPIATESPAVESPFTGLEDARFLQAPTLEPDVPAELEGLTGADPFFASSDSLPEADFPGDAALSVEAAERVVDEAATQQLPVSSPIVSALSQTPASSPSAPPAAASNWAFEEKLAAHKEWLDSHGETGRKADLAEAELPGIDLINVSLRYGDLQGSNLKGADLLLADLRDCCLVRTRLEDSCLVGANLEGANLEGATLDGAMGLLPRQLAGANLHDASVPDQIARFEARTAFVKASNTAMKFFTAMMAISGVSALIIWRTEDAQLLTDSSIFPFLHTRTAAALPAEQVYLIAPVALFIIYLVLQFHLQTVWDAVLQLPAIFPDGAEIGHDSPRIIRALLRAHFRWMNKDAPSTRFIERALGLVLAYWVAPVILLLFWARFLTVQDLHGTALHTLLVAVAFGVALYASTKIGRPAEQWAANGKRTWQWRSKLRNLNPLKWAAGMVILLLFLSVGTIKGVPHNRSRAPQFSDANIRRWAPDVFWAFGYDPYANLTEAAISTAPANWTGDDSQVSEVKSAHLNETTFRYAEAYGIFLARSHLWHSDWQGAFLSDSDFRGADLGQSTMRFAVMDQARFFNANLDRADLTGANLDRADFRHANLSYCSLENSIMIDSQFQGASLYGARLTGISAERANFERSDLRSSFVGHGNLEHADLRNAYLWSAKLPESDLRDSNLDSTILIDADLRNSDLRGAKFSGTVMSGANLSGAVIDGTDMRAALLLTAAQVCSTKSRVGAILTDSLAMQVRDLCGGPLLVAPAPTAIPSAPSAAAQSPAHPSHKAVR